MLRKIGRQIRTAIAGYNDSLRRGNIYLVQNAKNQPPIPQYLLHLEIIDAVRLAQPDVRDCFVERKSRGKEGYQKIARCTWAQNVSLFVAVGVKHRSLMFNASRN
jgi:hypothetical protein